MDNKLQNNCKINKMPYLTIIKLVDYLCLLLYNYVMDNLVRENERIDDLQYKGLKIIQNPELFCFGTDAILLAHFARPESGKRILELCSGSSVISILLAARYDKAEFTDIEIQPELADMASRSIAINDLADRIHVVNADFRYAEIKGNYDAVVVNPPYMAANNGQARLNASHAIARKELCCTLEDVINISAKALRNNGKLYMVHQPTRLADIVACMRSHCLEPKRLLTVHSTLGKPPALILIEAVKNARPHLKWESPLYIYDEKGKYTDKMASVYNGGVL